MFETFSQQALKVVMYCQEEARKAYSDMVTTDHILQGILRDEAGLVNEFLHRQGTNPEQLRMQLQQFLPTPTSRRPPVEIHFSDEARMVFQLAEQEARLFKHAEVESDHIFLGLLQSGEGHCSTVLEKAGIPMAHLRWNILRLRHQKLNAHLRTATLDRYSHDLTHKLETGAQVPIVEWQPMIERLIQYLGMQRKHSVLLVGEPGVGKTALIQGLNQYILASQVFHLFAHCRVVALSLDKMLAESETDENLYAMTQTIMGELRQSNDVILVIEDVHKLLLANKKEMEFVITQHLLTLLEEPNIYCLATTTPNHMPRLMSDTPVRHLFQIFEVPSPPEAFCETVLSHWAPTLEAHHQVKLPPETLRYAVKRAPEANAGQFLPESAMTLLDLSAARKRWQYTELQRDVRRQERRLRQLIEQRALMASEVEQSPAIRQAFEQIKADILTVETELQHLQVRLVPEGEPVLSPEDILKSLVAPV